MHIELLPQLFTVSKIEDLDSVNLEGDFTFIAKTDGEISLLCPHELTPTQTVAMEPCWRGLRLGGTMDFFLIGILSRLTAVLAAEDIPVFVVSTFDTDYFFVKNEDLSKALYALEEEYQIAIREIE